MSRARYQVFGAINPRCMSLAIMAAPVPERRPSTAQLLLPASPSSEDSSMSLAGSNQFLADCSGLGCGGRNPKPETRRPKEARNPKSEEAKPQPWKSAPLGDEADSPRCIGPVGSQSENEGSSFG